MKERHKHKISHYNDCRRKVRYASEHEALKHIKRMRQDRDTGYLDCYWCTECRGWHLTSREWVDFKALDEERRQKHGKD